MDRLSRDQEDIAGFFKRMAYSEIKLHTLYEGEVSHLHVGLKGTMNALFLKDLADKTRRGQRGRIEQGKVAGGNAYGYDLVRKVDGNGELARGERTINEQQAQVIRRIFRDYASGKSAKRIAHELNREGIAGPGGGSWGASTINGNPKRGNGILNNELYVGKLVWNRQRFIKDPDTGKRQARINPESEWVTQDVPELRIFDDGLWQAVKERQGGNRIERSEDGYADIHTITYRRRPKHLFFRDDQMRLLWQRLFDDFRRPAAARPPATRAPATTATIFAAIGSNVVFSMPCAILCSRSSARSSRAR